MMGALPAGAAAPFLQGHALGRCFEFSRLVGGLVPGMDAALTPAINADLPDFASHRTVREAGLRRTGRMRVRGDKVATAVVTLGVVLPVIGARAASIRQDTGVTVKTRPRPSRLS